MCPACTSQLYFRGNGQNSRHVLIANDFRLIWSSWHLGLLIWAMTLVLLYMSIGLTVWCKKGGNLTVWVRACEHHTGPHALTFLIILIADYYCTKGTRCCAQALYVHTRLLHYQLHCTLLLVGMWHLTTILLSALQGYIGNGHIFHTLWDMLRSHFNSLGIVRLDGTHWPILLHRGQQGGVHVISCQSQKLCLQYQTPLCLTKCTASVTAGIKQA